MHNIKRVLGSEELQVAAAIIAVIFFINNPIVASALAALSSLTLAK